MQHFGDGMEALGCEWQDDARFGQVMRHAAAGLAAIPPKAMEAAEAVPQKIPAIPDWLFKPAPDEGRPPRPLVPSRFEDDDYGDAPRR